MTAFDVYKIWNALRLHFTSNSYDYFTYNGHTKVSQKSFDMQRNKNIFYKLARKFGDQVTDYILANFLYRDKVWEEMLDTPESLLNFKQYTKRKQALFKIFCDDIQMLQYLCDINNRNFSDMFVCYSPDAKHYPQIVVYTQHGTITLETYIILDLLLKFTDSEKWIENLKEDMFWKDYKIRCDKYKPFMEKLINKTKYKLKLKELIG